MLCCCFLPKRRVVGTKAEVNLLVNLVYFKRIKNDYRLNRESSKKERKREREREN